jgi:hypothetical protein
MFLTRYDFDGDPDAMLAGHERLFATYPPEILDFHFVIRRPDGISVYDACPDEATARSFAASSEFTAAVTAGGLPLPRIEYLGEVTSIAAAPLRAR